MGTLPNTFNNDWNGSIKVHNLTHNQDQSYIQNAPNTALSVDMDFDASKCNSTYITNATIRPQSISVLVLLRL